jgi:hypothetical protein
MAIAEWQTSMIVTCTFVSDLQYQLARESNGQGGLYLEGSQQSGKVYFTNQYGNLVQGGTYVQTEVDLEASAANDLGGTWLMSSRALGYMNDAFDLMMVNLLSAGIANTVAPGPIGGLEPPGKGKDPGTIAPESTGRTAPANLKEQLAMQQAKSKIPAPELA